MCVDNDDGVRVDDDGDGEGEDEGEVDGQVQGAGQMFSRYFRVRDPYPHPYSLVRCSFHLAVALA